MTRGHLLLGLGLLAVAAGSILPPHGTRGAVVDRPGSHPFAGPVTAEAGSIRRVCQVTGEIDRVTGRPTVNRTESTAGFWGTDLGASFEHDGRLVVLFGDTHVSGTGLKRTADGDVLATSRTRSPDGCLVLDIPTDDDGGFRPITVPGVDMGAFGVPTGGLSAGRSMYLFVTTGRTPTAPMTRGVLARSDDGGASFTAVRDVSPGGRFVNVAPRTVAAGAVPGLDGTGETALLWGSGRYRGSDVHLAAVPLDRIEDGGAMRYFAGTDPATGRPLFVADEAAARPLFHQPCVGEFSVGHVAAVDSWVMLYNCAEGGAKGRILMRSADAPWGPWSEPSVLFDPVADGAMCDFIYPGTKALRSHGPECVRLSDHPGRHDRGDVYGPYVIDRFTRDLGPGRAEVHFLMSTWNPYVVVMMRTVLTRGPAEGSGMTVEAAD